MTVVLLLLLLVVVVVLRARSVVILKPNCCISSPGRLHDTGAEVPCEAARPVSKREGSQLPEQCSAQGVLHPQAAADGRHGHGRPRRRHAWLWIDHLRHLREHIAQVGRVDFQSYENVLLIIFSSSARTVIATSVL